MTNRTVIESIKHLGSYDKFDSIEKTNEENKKYEKNDDNLIFNFLDL